MPPEGDDKTTHCLMSTVFRSGVRLLRTDRDVVLGRHPSNDIVLPHHGVSRRHARVHWEDDQFRLIDLSSSNGTFTNGQRITRAHFLEDGDSFSMGPFEITYREFSGDVHALLEEARVDADATLPTDFTPDFDGDGVHFGGTFSDMELIEICQFLAINHKDGRLDIEAEELTGAIEFVAGKILNVSGGEWERRYEGVRELLSQPRGSFVFTSKQPTFSSDHRPLPTIPLLMELCRERDERLAPGGPALGILRTGDDTSAPED